MVACGQVSPINLAASLKSDRPDRPVYMLSFQESGSLRSRSANAGIDGQLSHQAFVARYNEWKQRAGAFTSAPKVPQPSQIPMPSDGQALPERQDLTQALGSTYAVGVTADGSPVCSSVGIGAGGRTASGVGGVSAEGQGAHVGMMPLAGGQTGGAGAALHSGGAASMASSLGGTGVTPSFGSQVGSASVAPSSGSQAAKGASVSGLPSGVSTHSQVLTPAPAYSVQGHDHSKLFAPGFSSGESAVPTPSTQVPAQQGLVFSGGPAARAQFIPVVSGSGGAGKSTVAALIATAAQAAGMNTVLVDYDLQFGEMSHYFSESNPVRIDDVLKTPSLLERLEPHGQKPALLTAPKNIEDASAVAEQAGALLDKLALKFDVIVANTGANWAEQHAALLERATKAVFLIDQRSSSLRACQHALDLCGRCGIATGPFAFVLNRCTKGSPFTAIDASCALRGAHVYELRDGGTEVDELMESGMLPTLFEEANPLAEDVKDLLAATLPNWGMKKSTTTQSGGIASILNKRTKKRRRGA